MEQYQSDAFKTEKVCLVGPHQPEVEYAKHITGVCLLCGL